MTFLGASDRHLSEASTVVSKLIPQFLIFYIATKNHFI